MQKFLEKVAAHIYSKHKNELDKIAVVLPNQRANLFLRKHFSSLLEHASWSPGFLSIEDFIHELSHVKVLDNLDLVIELYEVHKSIEKEQAEKLDSFLQWANTLLHDFNEIDLYLLDADSLYDHLTDLQRIKNWDPSGSGLTDFQKNNLRFWANLKEYYRLFQSRLLEKGKAYQGLSYRLAVKNIQKGITAKENFTKIYFIGFNALTRAEEEIIQQFTNSGKGEMLYDADAYYIDDPIQEAGRFLRSRKQKENQDFKWVFHDFQRSEKTLHINGLKGNIAQVKAVGNYLKHIPEHELSETAVILADENLLLPLLNSLPGNVRKANITMGLPLSSTSTYLFFQEIFQMYLNLERLNKDEEAAFYYKNLLKVLENPLAQSFPSNDPEKTRRKINQDKLFYLSGEKIKELDIAEELHPIFMMDKSSIPVILETIKKFILHAKEQKSSNPLENEHLFQFMKIFNRLSNLVNENTEGSINLKALYSLFQQMASTSTIPFYGEPLQGLQIMGVLESRTLDFKNVLFLSVNEGVLPAGKSINSFIPYDVKIQKGLPSYREKDAIFAYHFYRILQRAENIELFYNTQTESLNGGEESRFIKQLIQELPTKAPNTHFKEVNLNAPLKSKNRSAIAIPKTENILAQIKVHLEKGISPSALSSFITCPLDYYYKYILKLRIPEETEENLQANTFGSIIHNSLEMLYKPYLKQFLDVEHIHLIEKNLDNELRLAFAEQKFQVSTGKNHLIYQVASQYIKNFLSFDKKRIAEAKDKIQLISMEEFFDCQLNLNWENEKIIVNLKGKADRIEKEGNLIRIIDFKTGGTKNNELKINDADSYLSAEKSKALQLMMYSVIFSSIYPQNKILPNIFFLRSPGSGFLSISGNKLGLENEELDTGRNTILKAISMLLNKDSPFVHSTDAKYCGFCNG